MKAELGNKTAFAANSSRTLRAVDRDLLAATVHEHGVIGIRNNAALAQRAGHVVHFAYEPPTLPELFVEAVRP